MASASMKDIKLRIKSVESTMQITKAMELVASSKLRKAKERQERARPYFEELGRTLRQIESATRDFSSPYQIARDVKKRCIIIIAGDRGLAGGYNSNVFRMLEENQSDIPACYLPIGKRALDYTIRRGREVLTDAFAEVASLSVSDCFTLSKMLTEEYLKESFDEVSLIYTRFISLLSQVPDQMKLLPLQKEIQQSEEHHGIRQLVLYEPDSVSVYNAIVPNYMAGMLYGAICESVASELGARRTAMDAATKNASEMIGSLSLQYNRARQGSITQEITEIVAGAEH